MLEAGTVPWRRDVAARLQENPMATVASRREALAEFARTRQAPAGSGRGRRLIVGLALTSLLAAVIAWWVGAFGTPREIRDLRSLVNQEIASLEQVARSEAPFDGGATNFGAVFEQARAVPEAQRAAAWREMGRLFEARETVEVQSFFRLPAAERAAELDRRIRAEEERRKSRDASRGQGGGPPGGFPGGPPGGGASGGGGPRGGPPSVAGTGRTEEDRNQRYKASIDRTTPEQRAMRTEYRRVMQERRAKLGLADRRW
jgi:uncharacterized membrane protein YgcG